MDLVQAVKADALQCAWDPSHLMLFSAEVEPLVYYSHLFPALAALVLATVIGIRSFQRLTTKIFIIIALLFAIFAIFDQILWASTNPSQIMFFWSLLTYIEPIIYALTLYLVVAFAYQADVSLKSKYAAGLLLLPVFLLGPTHLNLLGFDYTNCWRLAVEGPLLYYVYFIEIVFVIWMITAALIARKQPENAVRRDSILYLLLGAFLFLLAFSSGNIFGTLLQGVMGEDAWVIGQYGFFGMPLFLGFIMYLIVRFELFYARVLYAEAINLGVFVLLISLLFIPNMETARPVIVVTLLLFGSLAYFLIQGVKKDLEQKKRIEQLAKKLEKANHRLKVLDQLKSEFVSIASHQLRSPLTSIRGYASMLLEGSYGKLSTKAQEAVERIAESSAYMATSVEDYLNVSRIEAGRMKYELSDFSLKDMAEQIVDDVRPGAIKKGLVVMIKTSALTGRGMVYADPGKTHQIIHNLLDNAIKYTQKGKVTVSLSDDKKKKRVYVAISDTGIGMSDETLVDVFEKFVRAKNANQVNVTGAGLGLYVAKKMAEEMGGTITPSSKGEGHGSTFTVELPFSM